jgi:hypothetical protein
VAQWEHLIVALPGFEAPTRLPGVSPAVATLNEEGAGAGKTSAMTVPPGAPSACS